MKLQALDHPKTLDFAARLNVSRPTAIGHLELFWHFAAKHAPRGNIGKFPDGSIARSCDWNGDPETFLKALLKSGLIDESEEHRFLVHDWPEHCPNWVRAQLQKLKQSFYVVDSCSNTPSSVATYEGTGEPSSRARVLPRVPKGNQGKPYQGEEGGQPPVDNSESKKGDFFGKNSPLEEPLKPRNGSPHDRRNGDFEAINEAVSKVLANQEWDCKPSETGRIAQLCGITEPQARESVRQLRDRGRLPAGVAA